MEAALVNIKEKIIDNIENSLYTVGIFLDFSKAFDSIKHHILFEKSLAKVEKRRNQKMRTYGIRGIALNLIKSYFNLRSQHTVVNGKCGPILFLIYINDIVQILGTPNAVLYTDDTNYALIA